MPGRATILPFLPTAGLFMVAGALSRFTLRTVESRFQVLALVLAALLFESTRRRLGGSPSIARLLLDSGAATIGVVAVKWSLEGLPYYLGSFAVAQ